jgi:copper(I)-binding protein
MRINTSLLHRVAAATVSVGALAFVLVACGSDATSEGSKTSTASTVGELGVFGQWARTSADGATTGAVYFTIQPAGDDTLTGVSVATTVAARAEMHRTMEMGSDSTMAGATTMMGTDTTAGGGMQMSPVESIALKGGQPFVFEPGGYHIMLFDLAKPLVKGDTFTVTLTFAKAGTVDVDVPVLDEAP